MARLWRILTMEICDVQTILIPLLLGSAVLWMVAMFLYVLRALDAR